MILQDFEQPLFSIQWKLEVGDSRRGCQEVKLQCPRHLWLWCMIQRETHRNRSFPLISSVIQEWFNCQRTINGPNRWVVSSWSVLGVAIFQLRLDVLKPLLNLYQLLFLARACIPGPVIHIQTVVTTSDLPTQHVFFYVLLHSSPICTFCASLLPGTTF